MDERGTNLAMAMTVSSVMWSMVYELRWEDESKSEEQEQGGFGGGSRSLTASTPDAFSPLLSPCSPTMPLEATMIVIDNSEYMRNGDYHPTRYEAQSDAVNTLFLAKIDSNPENTELGEIAKALHNASKQLGGSVTIQTAIAVAQLALKHRQNKNLRQRIVVLVGSPLEESADERVLVHLAKRLKKNNVALDVVAFGDGIEESGEGGRSILRAFVEAANSGDNSHYLAIPTGPHTLSDIINSSTLLAADRNIPEEAMGGAPAAAGSSTAGANFEFGVDPSLDPELAMALRMSVEEETARQAAAAAAAAAANPPAAASTPAAAPSSTTPQPAAAGASKDEEAQLQEAIALSQHGPDVEMSDAGGRAGAGSRVRRGRGAD
ncbi:hypothetical protein EVG20_g7645 [Dentipellis fragilis]|uniref:VWFA domain-containing protein n=1 Tax=Dentipellis fragilis TaxID=205917 RepID=A0A4Y9YE23_9AGAM|nr:hypothetical protein EVG20_g7645 [Dentipellis fragilis]